jgi:hypothetical protein
MSQGSNEPLNSSKFRNLAIDTSFIKQNANEYNDKISKFYTGGKKETTTISSVISRSDSITVTDAAGQRVEPRLPQTSGNSQTMDISKQELNQIIDKKIYDLASKMQQYADQTDATISQLQKKVAELERKLAQASGPQQTITQHMPQASSHNHHAHSAPASQASHSHSAEGNARTGSLTSNDVSIEKMFNFSNGRRN